MVSRGLFMVVKHLNDQTSVVQTLGMQLSETCQSVYHLIYAAKLAKIQNLEGRSWRCGNRWLPYAMH
jgi:hypothetical protein